MADRRWTPVEFSNLIELPQAMPLTKIWAFATSNKVGVRPTYFYEAWLQKRFAIPVSSILMILLRGNPPVAHSGLSSGMGRQAGRQACAATRLHPGFPLFRRRRPRHVNLGESGAVPPVATPAWMPILVFASIGGAWLIRLEGLLNSNEHCGSTPRRSRPSWVFGMSLIERHLKAARHQKDRM